MPQVRGSPIRAWIAKPPHPATLIGWDEEDRQVTVAVHGNEKGKARWADAEAAVLDCVKIHALAPDGKVLRVYRAPDAEDDAAKGELSEARSLLAQLPKTIEGIGRAMADMADRACNRQSEAFGKSFEALTAVVKAQSDAFTASMQQNRELQSELTALAKDLRETMLDAAEVEAEAIKTPESNGIMTDLQKMAEGVIGQAVVSKMMQPETKEAS